MVRIINRHILGRQVDSQFELERTVIVNLHDQLGVLNQVFLKLIHFHCFRFRAHTDVVSDGQIHAILVFEGDFLMSGAETHLFDDEYQVIGVLGQNGVDSRCQIYCLRIFSLQDKGSFIWNANNCFILRTAFHTEIKRCLQSSRDIF